jgi:hypothetical protein
MYGSGGIAPDILTSEQDGGKRSASLTACFTLGELAPGTDWIGGSVDPKAGMDPVKKKIISFPCQNLLELPRSSSPLSLYRLVSSVFI